MTCHDLHPWPSHHPGDRISQELTIMLCHDSRWPLVKIGHVTKRGYPRWSVLHILCLAWITMDMVIIRFMIHIIYYYYYYDCIVFIIHIISKLYLTWLRQWFFQDVVSIGSDTFSVEILRDWDNESELLRRQRGRAASKRGTADHAVVAKSTSNSWDSCEAL